ncbi:MAG TPA: YfhO family protein [Thermoanaerobaculia bacterium]|nr:YfhO family protein [Thermoanaerobaculia bacterium]
MIERRRHDLFAIALLCLIASVFFFDVLVGTDNFYMRDLTRYYWPTKQVLRNIVQGGEFPYWNRQFSAGQPIAANPEHEVFYPLTWLILLPSYDLGYRLHILVHVYIGLIGMYALLRSMDVRAPAAFFGAFSFGLGGLYLSYINLLPILFCAAWLPLTCLFVRKFLLRPNVRDFAFASLFLGLQFLVAEPTTVMQTGFLIGMYALYRGWYAAREWGHPSSHAIPEMLSRVLFIALISGSAIAVGAAQMIPAIDHVGESARSRTFDYSLVSAWSLPWAKFAELIYPNFLGHISVGQVMWYWGGGLYPGMGSPFLFNVYCGLLVTALAVGAIFVRPRGGRFVVILVLFSLLIALGGHTPLLRFLYDLGIATSIRYPEKFILVALFAAIIFAAQLLDRLIAGDDAIRDAALGFIAATTIVAVALAIFAFTPMYAKLFIKVWGLKGPKAAARMVELSREGWVIAAIRGGVLFALIWSVRALKRPLWLALMFAFLLADVLPVVHQVNPRMPARFFLDEPLASRALPRDRKNWRVFHEADWYGQEELAKKYFSTGDAVYWIVRNGLFPMTPAGEGMQMVLERDYDKTALLPTIDLTDSLWDVKRSGKRDWWRPFMAMANVRYRGEYKPFDEERKRVKKDMKRAVAIRYTDVGLHPRYYFADQLVTIRDRHDFVQKLSHGDYSERVAFVPGASFVPGRGSVNAVRETANTASLEVESQGRGFLVMSVTPNKYWNVSVDGKRVQPVVTNIGFQGIPVADGKHRVEMRYRNTLAANGLKVSIAAALLLIVAAFLPGRRWRA